MCLCPGECTGVAVVCDDLNQCTADRCEAGVCVYDTTPTSACDDGDACTINNVCMAGVCTGEVLVCDDGNACTENDQCINNGAGCAGTPVVCDDSSECTADSCDVATGCGS
jgi:slime mold repeat-containing protein